MTSLVISNMLTVPRPPKTALSAASALMLRRFFLSWRPFRLMYCQSFLVTSVRGIALAPITAPSAALGIIGFMNAALGFRLVAFRLAFFAAFFFLSWRPFRLMYCQSFLVTSDRGIALAPITAPSAALGI